MNDIAPTETPPAMRMLSRRVADALRQLRPWDTLLDDDPIAWVSRSRDPMMLLNVALRSRDALQQCRGWLESRGWH